MLEISTPKIYAVELHRTGSTGGTRGTGGTGGTGGTPFDGTTGLRQSFLLVRQIRGPLDGPNSRRCLEQLRAVYGEGTNRKIACVLFEHARAQDPDNDYILSSESISACMEYDRLGIAKRRPQEFRMTGPVFSMKILDDPQNPQFRILSAIAQNLGLYQATKKVDIYYCPFTVSCTVLTILRSSQSNRL